MNSADRQAREIAARIQRILAVCGQCHVIRKDDGTHYVHAVGFRRLARDPDARYMILTFDTDHLPRGVSAAELQREMVVKTVERSLGRPVRLLGGATVTYVVQMDPAARRLPDPEPRVA